MGSDHILAEQVFGRHIDLAPLRGRRRGLVGCPFHDDGHASLSVDLDRGLFNCFGCGAKGGVKRFAALVGEPLKLTTSPSRRPQARSLLDQARARVLAEARRQQQRLAPYRDLMTISEYIRRRLLAAHEARRLATVVGPSDRVWDALVLAAQVEREALNVEAAMDAILAGGRIA